MAKNMATSIRNNFRLDRNRLEIRDEKEDGGGAEPSMVLKKKDEVEKFKEKPYSIGAFACV